ncbi:hypothetical protein JI667_06775 [Bacillus sp. NTK074B]|uniref:hypothetical protein n=1 Tax=Bacillus sp. NTK074B TaxID=2802174 RepID=UPI001A8EB3DC|nr:hypothetical protein [Bacillus sp. NTK074B]
MNADKQDKHQQQRRAQSLYRKKKHKKGRRSSDNKLWAVLIVLAVVLALWVLTITEVYYIDDDGSVPRVLRKLAESFNLIIWSFY